MFDGMREDWEALERTAAHDAKIGLIIAIVLACLALGWSIAYAQDAILPNPQLTPGATNPNITQDNISDNICNPHWSTKSIRPPVSYTSKLKRQELQDGYTYQGDTNPADYELDHLVSLEIGGNPTDPKNLWPEPWEKRGSRLASSGTGAESKDQIENRCHRAVCAGSITLADAQHQIATHWPTACQ